MGVATTEDISNQHLFILYRIPFVASEIFGCEIEAINNKFFLERWRSQRNQSESVSNNKENNEQSEDSDDDEETKKASPVKDEPMEEVDLENEVEKICIDISSPDDKN